MRTNLTKEIREHLKRSADGLTIKNLALFTKRDAGSVSKQLKSMPDTYIDRWIGPFRGQYSAIWCIVVPPSNCPHPKDK
jgi:hypothetical protein